MELHITNRDNNTDMKTCQILFAKNAQPPPQERSTMPVFLLADLLLPFYHQPQLLMNINLITDVTVVCVVHNSPGNDYERQTGMYSSENVKMYFSDCVRSIYVSLSLCVC